MKIEPKTLKGFRDFLPKEAKKRQYALDILKKVFESYGFEPLETPALEYEEILTGKYGDEGDKLMYKFEDNGKRKVAMRYDQTVPLARVIAQYQNELPMPFKRYQIQNVWRAENTQKGRYREFLQVDADIVGAYSPLADAEILKVCANALRRLGFKNFKILINDRKSLNGYFKTNFDIPSEKLPGVVRIIDKIKKITNEQAVVELTGMGFQKEEAMEILSKVKSAEMSQSLRNLIMILEKNMDIEKEDIEFYPPLARGLDYYTGLIFEVEVQGYEGGSVAGGGRYDNLVGIFLGREIPAVGFSFGFDRLIEAMDQLKLFPGDIYTSKVFVAFAGSDLEEKALKLTNEIRDKKINAETYLEDATLEKQLKYADKKNIPYVVIVEENNLVLKDMSKRTQEASTLEEIIKKLS